MDRTNVIGHVKLLNRRSFTLVCRGAFAVPAPPPSSPLAHALAIFSSSSYHLARYSQATLLIGSGADIKTVQNRLGHSSASLTMNIYANAIEQNDRGAADIIGNSLKL